MSAGGSKKVIILSLCANFGIALSKLGGALFTGSAALMAEAVHSFSDCGNQALLLYGGHTAKRAPTDKFPLGRGKEMFFWSFVVALLLFSMGGAFSLYEGLHKISSPEPLNHPVVGIVILLIAVVLEGISFKACYDEVKKVNRYPSLWQWVKHTMAADLLVIFLEDLAALLGLCFALAALLLAWATGNTMWDGIGSCVIGVLLVAVAIVLAREVKSMLIGERPSSDYEGALRVILKTVMPEARIIRVIALQQAVDAVLLAYKIHPGAAKADLHETIEAVNRFEEKVRLEYPEIKWQFAELDVKD